MMLFQLIPKHFIGLEKNPLYDVQQFHPLPEAKKNKLTDYYEDLLEAAMNRLADRVRIRRIQVRQFLFSIDIFELMRCID